MVKEMLSGRTTMLSLAKLCSDTMRRPYVVFVLFLVAVTLRRASAASPSSTTADEEADYEDYEEAPKKGRVGGGRGSPTCPQLTLINGRVRLRSRGRIAKFMCRIGFQGIGKRFATCIRGHWNARPPICISRGCPTFIPPANGRMSMEYRGALLNFACNPGFGLVGSRTLYCDGKEWNATAPNCEVSVKNPPLGCDFEFEYLCGWSQDPTHDFDWKRFNFVTPSGHVGTGPSHDHTLGEGRDGFYMYIEASVPRMENDTARLFSPVYGASLARNACFRFWYHMYGATTGQMRVYVKPVSKDVSSLRPAFSVSGDQGNRWIMGRVHIAPLDEPFQVVVEGVRGPSYVSDSAIDDVQLLTGSECGDVTPSPSPDDVAVTTYGIAHSTDGPVHEESRTASSTMSSSVNAAGSESMNSELAASTEFTTTPAIEFTSDGPADQEGASISSLISSTVNSPSRPSSMFPLSTTDSTSSRWTTSSPPTTSWPLPATSPKMTTTTRTAFLRTTVTRVQPQKVVTTTTSSPTFTAWPTTTSSTTSTAWPTTTSSTTSTARPTTTSTARPTRTTTSSPTSTARPTRTTTSSPTSTIRPMWTTSRRATIFPTSKPVASPSAAPSTSAVHETTSGVTTYTHLKVTNGPTVGDLFGTKTAPTSTSKRPFTTMKTTMFIVDHPSSSSASGTKSNDDYYDDGGLTVMSMTTSTHLSNVIDIFPIEDDDVVEVPKRDENRLPPPWTYMKRLPSRNSTSTTTTTTTDVFVAAAARTANDRVSIPTVAGLIAVGLLSVAIVLIVARKFYRRNAYGRGRADTMSDDSDVRYLKDGEVRVEFGELHMRYISGKDIIADSL